MKTLETVYAFGMSGKQLEQHIIANGLVYGLEKIKIIKIFLWIIINLKQKEIIIQKIDLQTKINIIKQKKFPLRNNLMIVMVNLQKIIFSFKMLSKQI